MITVENVMSVVDINEADVNPETISFFETKIGRTYTDTLSDEHLYSISDPEELDTKEETLIVQAEVKELISLAQKHDAPYVRFISKGLKTYGKIES